LELAGFNTPRNKLLSKDYDWGSFKLKDLLELLDTFPPMFVGGAVMGVFFGVILLFIYNLLAKLYKNP
jgi:hypothetical protein